MESRFRMVARSVGYRMGKSAARRQHMYPNKEQVSPDFFELFAPEYVDDAEVGFDEGVAFERGKWNGSYGDTFHQGRIHL